MINTVHIHITKLTKGQTLITLKKGKKEAKYYEQIRHDVFHVSHVIHRIVQTQTELLSNNVTYHLDYKEIH